MTSISDLNQIFFINKCREYNVTNPDPKIKTLDITRAGATANDIYNEAKISSHSFQLQSNGLSLNSETKPKFLTQQNLGHHYWKEIYLRAALYGILASKKEVKLLEDVGNIPKYLQTNDSFLKTVIAALKLAGYTFSMANNFFHKSDVKLPLPSVQDLDKVDLKDEELILFLSTSKPRRPTRDLPPPPKTPNVVQPNFQKSNSDPGTKKPEPMYPPVSKSSSFPEVKVEKIDRSNISLIKKTLTVDDFIKDIQDNWLFDNTNVLKEKENELIKSKAELEKNKSDFFQKSTGLELNKDAKLIIEKIKAKMKGLIKDLDLSQSPKDSNFLFQLYQKSKQLRNDFESYTPKKSEELGELEKELILNLSAIPTEKNKKEIKIIIDVFDKIKSLVDEIEKLKNPSLIDGLSIFGTNPGDIGQFLFQVYEEGKNIKEDFFVLNPEEIVEKKYIKFKNLNSKKKIDNATEFVGENPEYLYVRLAFLLGLIHDKKKFHIPFDKDQRGFRASLLAGKRKGGSLIYNNIPLPLSIKGHTFSTFFRMGYTTQEIKDGKLIIVPSDNTCLLKTFADLRKKVPQASITNLMNYLYP